jgi:hypothetical protein
MITLEASLALLKEIQDKAQEKLAEIPDKTFSEKEWEDFRQMIQAIPPEDAEDMARAIE